MGNLAHVFLLLKVVFKYLIDDAGLIAFKLFNDVTIQRDCNFYFRGITDGRPTSSFSFPASTH
jgi:hypothetical protein